MFRHYFNRVSRQNKLHLDYDKPLDQYNIVKGCSAIFHSRFHLLEFWMVAWGYPGVKYIKVSKLFHLLFVPSRGSHAAAHIHNSESSIEPNILSGGTWFAHLKNNS